MLAVDGSPAHPFPARYTPLLNMLSDYVSLPKASEIVDLAAISVRHLKKLRDETTDDEWEKVIDNPLVDLLIDSLIDLECSVDEANGEE